MHKLFSSTTYGCLPAHSLRAAKQRARVGRTAGWDAYTRQASTSANPYPYPTAKNPSPHQIFHLPPSATRDQVKARYYDLVRIYHPDSPVSRAVPPETAHARFQAISAAYAMLSGKNARLTRGATDEVDAGPGPAKTYNELNAAMWRARQRRRAELDVGIDEVWKDRMIFGAVVLTLGLFVVQTYSARQHAMSQALERTRYPPPSSSATHRRVDDSLLALPAPEESAANES